MNFNQRGLGVVSLPLFYVVSARVALVRLIDSFPSWLTPMVNKVFITVSW